MLDLIENTLTKLLALFHGFEAVLNILTSSRKWLTSTFFFVCSGLVIWLADISSVDDAFSALVVPVFVVSGIYFFYSLTNFLRGETKRSN